MRILAIDTSTQWCSVAIHHDHGGTSVPPFLLIKHEELGALASGVVLDWVAELAQQANIDLLDLEQIAVGIGPGAFTGIRIGVGVAQGLALALNKDCCGISCLDVVAYEAIQQLGLGIGSSLLVAVDARMNEVYCGNYRVGRDGYPELVDAIELMSPDEVRSPVEFYYLVGNAVIAYPQEMLKVSEQARAVLSSAVPHARSLAELAKSGRYPRVKPEHLQPLYVRDKVAQTIAERQAGV